MQVNINLDTLQKQQKVDADTDPKSSSNTKRIILQKKVRTKTFDLGQYKSPYIGGTTSKLVLKLRGTQDFRRPRGAQNIDSSLEGVLSLEQLNGSPGEIST